MTKNNNNITFALMNASSDLAIIIDLEGIIIEINDAALRRFSLKRELVISTSLFELLPSKFINFSKLVIKKRKDLNTNNE